MKIIGAGLDSLSAFWYFLIFSPIFSQCRVGDQGRLSLSAVGDKCAKDNLGILLKV